MPPKKKRGGGRPSRRRNTRVDGTAGSDDRAPPKDTLEFDGTVIEQLRNASFRVELANGHVILARVAGKMRRFRIRVMPGDRVVVAMSTYDTSMGRITFRHRN